MLRRHLFELAHCHPISATVRPTACDMILPHISFPAFAGPDTPVIWSSQGFNPPEFYEAAGPVGYRDVVDLYERLLRRAAALLRTGSGAQKTSARGATFRSSRGAAARAADSRAYGAAAA